MRVEQNKEATSTKIHQCLLVLAHTVLNLLENNPAGKCLIFKIIRNIDTHRMVTTFSAKSYTQMDK